MIYHDIEQNTDEWYALRCGHLGGSSMSTVMANDGKAFGDPAKRLAMKIATERLTGKPIESTYTNKAMDDGHLYEPLARQAYEHRFFVEVKNGGFFDAGNVGFSPDGLVGDDGLVEIKSVGPTSHIPVIKKQNYDTSYKWQLICNMHYSERQWIDFVSYCPVMPEQYRLYTYRLKREDVKTEIESMEIRVAKFFELVESNIDLILNSNYEVNL